MEAQLRAGYDTRDIYAAIFLMRAVLLGALSRSTVPTPVLEVEGRFPVRLSLL
jgi:hypothetical protein